MKKGKGAGQLLKDTHLIGNVRLRRAVVAAVEGDLHYGPHVDAVKRVMGLEYEELLSQKLYATSPYILIYTQSSHGSAPACSFRRFRRAHGVPFLTEEALRLRGDAKTPDALLPVPLLVRGRVVNWIDSKAMYGEAETHGEYYASQYTAYLNRFDAGMVIYWYGYDAAADTDPRVLLADGFPAECELMSHMQLPRRQSSGAIVGGGGET